MSIPAHDTQRFTRVASTAAAVSASKASASTGAAHMKWESLVWFLAAAGSGVTMNTVGAPGFATRMALILCGAGAGAMAAAMFMDDANPWQRLRRGIGSMAGGFIVSLGVLAKWPSFGTVDEREWLLIVSGTVSALIWLAILWGQKRNVFDNTLDALAEKAGLKTNKRKREKDEHEDGGP